MKIIVISQPKAGTYLLANLLQEIGFRFTNLHIGVKKYERYPEVGTPKYKRAIRNPKEFEHRQALAESLKMIPDGAFAVSHLAYNKKTEYLLQDFHKILITRPSDEIIESLARWWTYSGRPLGDINKTVQHCRNIMGWWGRDRVYELTFSDIINANQTRIEGLQSFLNCDVGNIEELCRTSRAKQSKTKVPKTTQSHV